MINKITKRDDSTASKQSSSNIEPDIQIFEEAVAPPTEILSTRGQEKAGLILSPKSRIALTNKKI